MSPISYVIEKKKIAYEERFYDIFSRMLKNRFIFLNGEIKATDEDHWLTAKDALDFGLIDKIVQKMY